MQHGCLHASGWHSIMEDIFYSQLSRCLSMTHSTHLETNNGSPDGLLDQLGFQPSSSLLTVTIPTLTPSKASTGQPTEVGLYLSDSSLYAPATLCSVTRSESVLSGTSVERKKAIRPATLWYISAHSHHSKEEYSNTISGLTSKQSIGAKQTHLHCRTRECTAKQITCFRNNLPLLRPTRAPQI